MPMDWIARRSDATAGGKKPKHLWGKNYYRLNNFSFVELKILESHMELSQHVDWAFMSLPNYILVWKLSEGFSIIRLDQHYTVVPFDWLL